MTEPTLVLLHSPLTDAAVWGRLPAVLAAAGRQVLTVAVSGDQQPPYAQRYVAEAARAINTGLGTGPTVLVGHSGAGPLLPAVAVTRRAVRAQVAGYVFLDAMLPRTAPGSRLDLLRGTDPALADQLLARLAAGGSYPDWTEADLREQLPEPGLDQLLRALRPRGQAFFAEQLPTPLDWPDAPCGYLCTSEPYQRIARLAAGRGWPVVTGAGGHFAALADPRQLADQLLGLLERL